MAIPLASLSADVFLNGLLQPGGQNGGGSGTIGNGGLREGKRRGAAVDGNSRSGSDSSPSERDNSTASSDEEDALGAERHAQDLRALAEKDPDFYEYLRSEEPGLLDFDVHDSGSDDEAEAPEDGRETSARRKRTRSGVVELTMPTLRAMFAEAFKKRTLTGLKRLLSAFRCGCHLGDDPSAGENGQTTIAKFRIGTSEVYNALMMRCLSSVGPTFLHHLYPEAAADPVLGGDPTGEDATPAAIAAGDFAQRDPRLQLEALKRALRGAPPSLPSLMLGFFRPLLHVLGQLKDRELLSLVLKRLELYTALLALFPRLGRGYLRALLAHWGAASTSGEEASAQLLAFLRLRELALSQPFPFLEECLKGTYMAFARNVKFTTEQTRPAVTFMTNCVVELFGLDAATSYQLAFVYVRQLALHLRQALRKGTREARYAIYKWQVFNCLKLWTEVVAAYPGPDQLQLLVFPLTQVVLGVARLMPSPRHFPMRFQCVRLLQQLAAASHAYIPTSALLLPVLQCPALTRKPRPSTEKAPVVPLLLKLGRDAISTRPAQEAVVAEAFRLLRGEQELYRFTPAYPEAALPLLSCLRRFAKATPVGHWRAQARGLIETVQRYSRAAAEARTGLLPTGVGGLEALRAENDPEMSVRLAAVAAEMEAAVATVVAAAAAKRSEKAERKARAQSEGLGGLIESDLDDEQSDSDLEDERPAKRLKAKNDGHPVQAVQSVREGKEEGGDVVQDLEPWSDDEGA